MKKMAVVLGAVAMTSLGACSQYGMGGGPGYASNDWDAARYYRAGNEDYYLTRDDRIYRGSDGRYYCRRPDGTTGLVVGSLAGGVLGTLIAPRGSQVIGALLGGAAGAAVGEAVEKRDARCR